MHGYGYEKISIEKRILQGDPRVAAALFVDSSDIGTRRSIFCGTEGVQNRHASLGGADAGRCQGHLRCGRRARRRGRLCTGCAVFRRRRGCRSAPVFHDGAGEYLPADRRKNAAGRLGMRCGRVFSLSAWLEARGYAATGIRKRGRAFGYAAKDAGDDRRFGFHGALSVVRPREQYHRKRQSGRLSGTSGGEYNTGILYRNRRSV